MNHLRKIPFPATPYKQNALFSGGDETALNACVGRNGGPYGLTDYARGYVKAGRRLVESLKENSAYVDTLIYPLVYIYRHAVELYLKQLATYLPCLSGVTAKPELTHRLVDNWNAVRTEILKHSVYLDPPGTLVASVNAVITDLIEIDPKGEAFRFPHAREGNLFLQDTSLINVVVFADALDIVADVMDYWIYTTADMLEEKGAFDSGCI